MAESSLKNQAILEAQYKKWSEVACCSFNKLLSFYHFSCITCQSNFCLECYNRVISANKSCMVCKSDFINIFEVQKSEQEYLSILIRCEYTVIGCQTILPFNDIYLHRLGCPFTPYTCLKCKKNNLPMGSRLQHKNECEFEETSCPECKLIVLRKELEEHSKTNCLYNLSSCLSCIMTFSNKILKEHSLYCNKNSSFKASRTTFLFKHKYFTVKPFKRIVKWRDLTNNYYLFYFAYHGKHLHIQNMKT